MKQEKEVKKMFYTGEMSSLAELGFTYNEEGELEWDHTFESPYTYKEGIYYHEYIYIYGAIRRVEIGVEQVEENGEALDASNMGCYAMSPELFNMILSLTDLGMTLSSTRSYLSDFKPSD